MDKAEPNDYPRSVMRRSLLLCLLGGALAACGGSDRTSGTRPTSNNNNTTQTKTPQALAIELATATAAAGTRSALVARVTYDDASTGDVSASATWASSAPSVAEVVVESGAAFLDAKASGTTQLTAVFGDLVARADFVVTPEGEALVGLSVTPSQVDLQPGAQVTLSALAVYDSGAQRDVTAAATWQSSDANVATVQSGQVTGVALGQATITVTLGSFSQGVAVAVIDGPTVASVGLDPAQLMLNAGASRAVTARATYTDGSTVDVTQGATWTSSNPAVATAAAGTVSALSEGSATVTVAYQGVQASLQVTVTAGACAYPTANAGIRLDGTLPSMSWTGVYDESGSTRDFSTEAFFCDPEFAAYESMVIIVGAEWCPNCPDYKRRANEMQPRIAAAGGMMVYVEIEDRQSQPASHQVAQRSVDAVISNGVGLRIGDAETMPTAMVFGAATNAVPTAYVVRKSDMKIIADQGQDQYLLDFVSLAYEAAGTTPPSACGPADEEPFEPNDDPSQAGALTPGQVVDGGVCGQDPDFYTVNVTGAWTLDLTFSNAIGDLDVYVWDTMTNQPLEVNGQVVGSDSADDNESFSHSGPATILVYGYNGATAPYQLLLTAN